VLHGLKSTQPLAATAATHHSQYLGRDTARRSTAQQRILANTKRQPREQHSDTLKHTVWPNTQALLAACKPLPSLQGRHTHSAYHFQPFHFMPTTPRHAHTLRADTVAADAHGLSCWPYSTCAPEMIGSSDTVPIASTLATVSHSPWSHLRWPNSEQDDRKAGRQAQHRAASCQASTACYYQFGQVDVTAAKLSTHKTTPA
jgi:hypothetical protein